MIMYIMSLHDITKDLKVFRRKKSQKESIAITNNKNENQKRSNSETNPTERTETTQLERKSTADLSQGLSKIEEKQKSEGAS